MRFLSFFKNKVVFYLFSRYFTYFIQFVTSVLIAAQLGPYYLGIWGFVLLLLNYFGQCHFGISTSFNILYIHNKDSEKAKNSYISNSLILNGYLAILVLVLLVLYYITGGDWFKKYHSDRYFAVICFIAILQYFQQFLTFLFRVKNKLLLVALCQTLIVLLSFVCVLLLKGEGLILGLIWSYFISYAAVILIAFFSHDYPSKSEFSFSIKTQKEILSKGLYLFLYNSCFYFIVISIRTIVSSNYEVDEFGLFTFSFTMAQAVILLLDSINFIIYPKIIDRLSVTDNNMVYKTLEAYRIAYITTSHFLIYFALIAFPILIYLMPKYSNGLTSLNLIALSVLMNTCGAGYSTMLISKNKEKLSSILSIVSLALNIVIALFLVHVLKVTFDYVILATLFTYLIYAFAVTYFGNKCIGQNSITTTIKHFLPIRMLVPYIVAMIVCVFKQEIFIWLPLIFFIILNFNDLKKVLNMGKAIIYNPNKVDL